MNLMIRKRRLLIAAVALGTLLNPLNTSMISVALTRLQEEFRLTFPELSWLISTFYIASAIAQPVMGKFSDQFGARKVFLFGLILAAAGSMLAPLSPGFGWLIGFRVIQAIGSSAVYPAGMSLIRREITEHQAKALAVLSVFSSVSAAVGPVLSGFLLHYGDWPLIFLINFPVILLSFTLALKVLPKDEGRGRKGFVLDAGGILLFSAAVVFWLLLFLSLRTGGQWWRLPVAVGLTLWFYRHEAGRSQPFIDVLFLRKNRQVSMVYLQFVLINMVFYSILFGIPSYLDHVRGFDSQTVGTLMLSVAGFGILSAPLAARWIGAAGSSRPLLFAASVSLVGGTSLMLVIRDHTAPIVLFLILSVIGISNGLLNIGMQTALYASIDKGDTGIASGLFMTSRFMGTILSSSLLAALFSEGTSTAALHWMGGASTFIGLVLVVLSSRFVSSPSGSKKELTSTT